MGEEEFRLGKVVNAIADLEKALDLAKAPGESLPTAASEHIIRLQLQLGDYYYQTGDLPKAAVHYSSARDSCPGHDVGLMRKADASHIRAQLRILDAPESRQLLLDTLNEGGNESRFVSFLRELTRDNSHDIIIAKTFTVARSDKSLFRDIVRALETAATTTDNPAPADANDKFAEDETRGMLLFDMGLAAYHYKIVASDGLEPNIEAFKLWKDCRKQLGNVGGERAYATRNAATTALCKYYFQSMVDGNHSDSLEALEALAEAESRTAMSKPIGFLGALHSTRGDKERARKPLVREMKFALQILSDEDEENDTYGFAVIKNASLRIQDFPNSAVAISLSGEPDLVTACLVFEDDPSADATARQVSRHARCQVPDSGKQRERVQAAVEHVQGVLNGHASTLDEAAAKTYNAIKAKLEALLEAEAGPEGGNFMLGGGTYCDGTKDDGRVCYQRWDAEHELYQCLYCPDMTFCARCLTRLLRHPDAQDGTDIFACSAEHKWLRMPRTGSDFCVGSKAGTVRVPADVRPAVNNDQVLEIVFDESCEELSLQAWKESLATSWGFSLDEIIHEMHRVASAESSTEKEDSVSHGGTVGLEVGPEPGVVEDDGDSLAQDGTLNQDAVSTHDRKEGQSDPSSG